MKKTQVRFAFAALLSLVIATSCDDSDAQTVVIDDPISRPNQEFFALTASGSLLKMNANDSSAVASSVNITNLMPGETLRAIDFRPATGQLYGISSQSRLYVINQLTGAARAVNANPLSTTLNDAAAGFDFNPTVDRIRLVSASGQNLRANPETGALVATDGNISNPQAMLGATAYTGNTAGSTTTTMYVIDFTTKTLYKQDPPNDGIITAVGSLDLADTFAVEGGFDITPNTNLALATAKTGNTSKLLQIDLQTGKAVDLGSLPTEVLSIAIPTNPVAYAIDNTNNLHIFNFLNVNGTVAKPITNLQSGENIIGIDMRPATGQLYALSSTGRLLTLNMSNGAATAVGNGTAIPLQGTNFGFDFNPTVDRIRVVSDSGQNLRLNPNDGTLVATDGALNPGTPQVTATAYTNNFAGATATTMININTNADVLYTQSPPNNGVLAVIGPLGTDFIGSASFDIGGLSNFAYAILNTASGTKIYTINTTTGGATAIADFPAQVRGFAVGLGF